MDKSILEEKKTILATDYVPKHEQLIIHPEEGETFTINKSFSEIYDDIKFLDDFLIDKARSLDDLVVSITERLDNIDLDIKSEQERLQDIKMLCNKYTDFDNVIPITPEKVLQGDYTFNNGTFYCGVKSNEKSKLIIKDIVGNGLEGNKYVYKDYDYVANSVSTANRAFIIDDSVTSCYEYQRITASSTEKYLISDFNTDSEGAKCTVTLQSDNKMNLITITSDNDSLYITGIQYSNNGIDYYPLEIPMIKLNDKLASYENYDYICGDNKIYIPFCNYVKITFQSSGTTDDLLAYNRIMFSHTIPKTEEEKAEEDAADGIIGGFVGGTELTGAPQYNEVEDATIVVKSAKRHVIKINDITANHNEYISSSYFTTNELISEGKFYSAALFLNAYIPTDLDNDSVSFILTVNGIDYEAVPVNSDTFGYKIFRYSQGRSLPEYTKLLDEPIKSLRLTVKMNGSKEFTPFLGNVKVLLGGDI